MIFLSWLTCTVSLVWKKVFAFTSREFTVVIFTKCVTSLRIVCTSVNVYYLALQKLYGKSSAVSSTRCGLSNGRAKETLCEVRSRCNLVLHVIPSLLSWLGCHYDRVWCTRAFASLSADLHSLVLAAKTTSLVRSLTSLRFSVFSLLSFRRARMLLAS